MRLLRYSVDDEYNKKYYYSDVTQLSDEEIKSKIRYIEKSYENQLIVGGVHRCSDFRVMEIDNLLELINSVGVERAMKIVIGLEKMFKNYKI